MKHNNILLFAIMVLVLTCVGCGQQARKGNSDTVPPTQTENTTSSRQDQNDNSSAVPPTQAKNTDEQKKDDESAGIGTDENPSDGNKLFEISNLSGTVTEFSDDGCKISPTIESGDNVAYQAAPGYEDTIVSVSYNSDCIFQIAHIDFKTAAATYESATVEDVKKQTSLIICGEYDENDVLHANRVFIHRIEGM